MTKAYESIKRGIEEALAHANGDLVDVVIHEIRIGEPDVAAIRAKSGLSQRDFAQSIGVAVGTLKGWEQGRRRPEGPARVLLALIDKRPSIIQDELGSSVV